MTSSDGGHGMGEWPIGRKLATGFAALACVCSLVALFGWVIGSRELSGFGVASRPPWPLTGIGYLTLSLGFLAAILGKLKEARLLWGAPLLIATASLVQNAFGIDIGTDQLLFRESIQGFPFAHPGRPGATPTTIFLLLGIAGYASSSGRWQHDAVASLIASCALGVAMASAMLIVFAAPDDPVAQLYTISVPSAMIGTLLTLAYVFWHSSFGWVRLLSSDRPRGRLLQLLLPAVLIFPVLPSLAETFMQSANLLSPLSAKLLVVLGNILAVGLITYWAITRVAKEQKALLGTMEALRISEERLATATSAHELGVFEWDVTTGRLEWSPGTEQRLGLVAGSLSTFDSWRAQIEPQDAQRIIDTIARTVAEHADTFSFRYRFLQANGNVRAVEGSSRAFYDKDGNLIRTVGVILDVTERDEREAELRARAAQLRSILETVPDAMVVIDEDGNIRQFSAAAEALWGYRAEDVLGRRLTILAAADEREAAEAGLQQFARTRETSPVGRPAPVTGETADGRRFPMEIRTSLARFDGKTLVTIFFRDISERLATEERLSDLSTELAHVSRQSAMSELAADIAHELNQPLSATANFLAAARMLINNGEGGERVAEMLQHGADQTQRAGQIIRRLRDFTQGGDVEMRIESVERTIRDAVELVLVGTSQFHIRVDFDLDSAAQQIYADRIQVQQVLVNLLRNANDALRTLPKGERQITIASRKVEDDMVEIEVSDTGPGIPDSILEQLFSRFTTTKSGGGGMGIGLSISKRIIESHGGALTAENRPGGGATFRFTLPAVEEGVE